MSRRILSGVVAGWGQTIITIIVSLVQIRLIVSYLPQEIAGIWFLFLTMAGYILLMDLGISPTLSREIGFILGRNSDETIIHQQIADLLATALRLFKLIAFTVGIGAGLVGWWFLSNLTPVGYEMQVAIAWTLFAIGAGLNIIGGASFAALYGMGRISTERLLKGLVQLCGLGFVYGALQSGLGVVGLAVVWLAQGIAWRGLAWLALHRFYPWLRTTSGHPSWAIAQRIAIPSIQWSATNIGATLILGTDSVVIALTIGTAVIPGYEALAKIVNTALIIALYSVSSSAPFVAQAHAAQDTPSIVRLLLRNVRLGMAMMLIIDACLLAYGDLLISIWIGSEHFVGYPILIVFVVLLTLEAHHVIHATVVMATGRIVFYWFALAAGIINLIVSFVLAGKMGLLGVALGTLIAQLITNNWYAPFYSLKIFAIPLQTYLLQVIIPLMIAAVIIVGVAIGTRFFVQDILPSVVIMLLGTAITAFVGCIVTFFCMLDTNERQWVKQEATRRLAPRT